MHSKETLKRKLKKLNMLADLIYKARNKSMLLFFPSNPRANYAIVHSTMFTACLLVLCGLVQMSDWVFSFIIILSFVISYIVSIKTSKAAETWLEEFDKFLLAYEPVDVDNFRFLQESVKKSGSLNLDTLKEWIHIERGAINVLLHPKRYEKPIVEIKSEPLQNIPKFIDRNI